MPVKPIQRRPITVAGGCDVLVVVSAMIAVMMLAMMKLIVKVTEAMVAMILVDVTPIVMMVQIGTF